MTKGFLTVALVSSIVLFSCATTGARYPQSPRDTKLFDLSVLGNETLWTTNNVHDPSIFKDGSTYYLYTTDVAVGRKARAGIQIRKSSDLVNWSWVGYALHGVPKAAKDYTGAEVLWAPDVIKLGSTYYLYYSASVMYSQQSCIGFATSKSPEGPWEDQGLIVKSTTGDPVNAIDPAVSFDAAGKLWMVYGSFADGIYLMQLDASTGKPADAYPGKLIACRSVGGGPGCEGPYIIYNPEFKKYYLFLSYDNFLVDYSVRVGRADEITGPYLDYTGHKMTDYPNSDDVPLDVDIIPQDVGYKLIGGYRFKEGEGWAAPGHNSVLNDNGDWYIFHHARPLKDKNWPYLHVRKLLWSADGWPMASPERYAGEKEGPIPASAIAGSWELVSHQRLAYEDPVASSVTLEADGTISGELGTGTWKFTGGNGIEFALDDFQHSPVKAQAELLPSWDWESGQKTLVFTGIDGTGQAWWGKKVE